MEENLQVGITEWNRFIPVQPVSGAENCDIEVTWVNHLLPGVLGITRLTTPKKGSIHVEIWMLRPTFYVQDIPEHAVQVALCTNSVTRSAFSGTAAPLTTSWRARNSSWR